MTSVEKTAVQVCPWLVHVIDMGNVCARIGVPLVKAGNTRNRKEGHCFRIGTFCEPFIEIPPDVAQPSIGRLNAKCGKHGKSAQKSLTSRHAAAELRGNPRSTPRIGPPAGLASTDRRLVRSSGGYSLDVIVRVPRDRGTIRPEDVQTVSTRPVVANG
jgi:hypothetical protein